MLIWKTKYQKSGQKYQNYGLLTKFRLTKSFQKRGFDIFQTCLVGCCVFLGQKIESCEVHANILAVLIRMLIILFTSTSRCLKKISIKKNNKSLEMHWGNFPQDR